MASTVCVATYLTSFLSFTEITALFSRTAVLFSATAVLFSATAVLFSATALLFSVTVVLFSVTAVLFSGPAVLLAGPEVTGATGVRVSGVLLTSSLTGAVLSFSGTGGFSGATTS